MSQRQHTPEEIRAKLHQAAAALAEGVTVAEACRRIGVSPSTYRRWRRMHGGAIFASNGSPAPVNAVASAPGVAPAETQDVTPPAAAPADLAGAEVVVVLGMHRSGTSALTGILSHLGFELGPCLMAAKPEENPRGFFEHTGVVDLHDRLLQTLGFAWDDPGPMPLWWHESTRVTPYEDELTTLLARDFAGAAPWAVKDPRLCRLLPLWMRVFRRLRVQPRFLIVHRPAVEVAASLRQRNGFSPEKSARLWAEHLLSAERLTRGMQRLFLGYDALLADPVGTLERGWRELDLAWELPADAADAIHAFIEPALRNHRAEGLTAIDLGGMTPSVATLEATLADADGAGGAELAAAFDRVREQLPRDPWAGTAADGRVDQLVTQLAERTEWLRVQADEQTRQRERLDTIEREHAVHLESMQSQLDGWERQLELRAQTLHDRERALDEARVAVFALRDRVRAVTGTGDEQKQRLDRLEGTLDERTNWLQIQAREFESLRSVVLQIRRDVAGLRHPSRFRKYTHLAGQAIRHPRLAIRFLYRTLTGTVPTRVAAGPVAPLPVADATEDPLSDAALARIAFPACDEPAVSVIIPVYDHAAMTARCLASIAQHGASVPFEVVLMDDASPKADEVARLKKVEGLRFLRNETNQGFIRTCNRGAAEARGTRLLFLNNDTVVTEGWMDALLGTFETFPDAGLVGGKLVFPDGTVQEAGGIVWRDGSAWNYGRGKSPAQPELNYARKADYCSGACLMIERALFEELGRFDELYAPAYYEDTDLAFRVRDTGRAVYYQPACFVYHDEGTTSGTDTGAGVKRHQVVNAKRFYGRWRETLEDHRANADRPEEEKERDVTKRVLIIDHRMVTPDMDSGSVRMFNLMRVFQDLGSKVTFLPDNLEDKPPYTAQLQARGIEAIHTPFVTSIESFLEERGHEFDLVLLSRLAIASRHIVEVRRHCPGARILFDTVDLHFLRMTRAAELSGDARAMAEAEATRARELEVAALAHATIVVSPHERDVLAELAPHLDVHVVSNIHETDPTTTPFAERKDIFFIGGYEHPPNVDGVRWFVDEIFPFIRSELPGVKFHIIGSKPPPEILKLDSEATPVAGFVPDVTPYFEGCRLSVAPLRYGAGVKGKVNHSLARGVPCVATSIASEGMWLEDGVDILIADDPAAFAKAVVRLYEDERLWYRLAAGGLENIEQRFSFTAAACAVSQVSEGAPVS